MTNNGTHTNLCLKCRYNDIFFVFTFRDDVESVKFFSCVVFRLVNTGQYGCPPCSIHSFISLCEYFIATHRLYILKNDFTSILFFIKCKLVALLLLIFVIGLLTVFSNKSSLRPHIYSICRT